MATYILFLTPILKFLDPSSRLHRHRVHNAFTYMQAKYTHEIKISKSFFLNGESWDAFLEILIQNLSAYQNQFI